MNRAVGFARGVWSFLVGDDWRIAAAVVVALGLAAILVSVGVSAWWIVPVAVAAILTISVWSAADA